MSGEASSLLSRTPGCLKGNLRILKRGHVSLSYLVI